MSVYSKRAKHAALSRHRPADDPDVVTAATELRAATLEQHIKRVVDEAPPLTDEQRTRLAAILRGSGVSHA